MRLDRKPLHWIASSKKDLRAFPDEVRRIVGHALDEAQCGDKSPLAKPLHGFPGVSVMEIVADFDSDAFRAVYTLTIKDAVYVLHCFQKKSKRGAELPKPDQATIEARYKFVLSQHRTKPRQE